MAYSGKCGYCGASVDRWQHSPCGRRYCPECGAIPKDEQRDRDAEF